MSSFQYSIEYIKGKNNAMCDFLSRFPVPEGEKGAEGEPEGTGEYLHFTATSREWPIDNDRVRTETSRDRKLEQVMQYVRNEKWSISIPENLKPYFNRRDELHIEGDILMWRHRIVIPVELRKQILTELHAGHFGIVKTKTLARFYVY